MNFWCLTGVRSSAAEDVGDGSLLCYSAIDSLAFKRADSLAAATAMTIATVERGVASDSDGPR